MVVRQGRSGVNGTTYRHSHSQSGYTTLQSLATEGCLDGSKPECGPRGWSQEVFLVRAVLPATFLRDTMLIRLRRPVLIPLTLLYTSILPLLLNLFLAIWHAPAPRTTYTASDIPVIPAYLPPIMQDWSTLFWVSWNTTDRIWAGTRLLGGMSSGFGLRVVLPTRPWETTLLVLSGWVAAAGIGKGLDLLHDAYYT
jgi:hypothetical protein